MDLPSVLVSEVLDEFLAIGVLSANWLWERKVYFFSGNY